MPRPEEERLPGWVRLPPVLLCAVAAFHFALVAGADLSPWLGGGFGMFAAADPRRLEAFGEPDHTPLELPASLADAAERARALPTPGRLRDLALRLDAALGRPVSVEVWRDRLEARSLGPRPELLRRAESRRGG